MSEMSDAAVSSSPIPLADDAERKFTQEDVNRIVAERLKRVRIETETEAGKRTEAKAAELEKKEKELLSTEQQNAAAAFLRDNGYPAELLDQFDTSDIEAFKTRVNAVYDTIVKSVPTDSRILDLTKKLVTIEYSLPDELASRLKGATEEELREDAKTLSRLFDRVRPTAPLGSGEAMKNNNPFSLDDAHVPRKFGS